LFAAKILATTNIDIQKLLEDYMEDMKGLVEDMNEEL
jgi:phosphoribosylcarboxyaminoimidazole (NCAIR) mutase